MCILLQLDNDGDKMAAIRRDFANMGVEMCCMQVFQHWLKGEGREPVNWSTVKKCLQDMDRFDVVKDIEEIMGE